MKHVRKIFAFAMSLFMAFAIVGPAFAEEATGITVQQVQVGETYTAYKILNYREDTQNGNRVVTYYLTNDQYNAVIDDGGTKYGEFLDEQGFDFTQASNNGDWFVSNAKDLTEADAADIAENLRQNWNHNGALATATATGAKNEVTGKNEANFTNLGKGYYFVTTTTGTLCALHEDGGIATVVEKNTVPTVDKKQSATESNYSDAQLDLNIGDTVYYDVEVTIGKGANWDIVLTDELSDGLTLDQDSIAVKKGTATVDTTNYSIADKSAHGYKLTLNAAYVKTLAESDVITVTYKATINENAVIRDDNTNKVTLTYSEQSSDDTTVVKTYDAKIVKTDGNNKYLTGAEFNIYTAATGGTLLKFTKDNTGYYLNANGSEKIEAGDGKGINIRGLAPGDYWLEETVAPKDYNKLSSRQKFTVSATDAEAGTVTVINQQGATMPSTGGIGTTIFYIVGGVMVAGAAIFLLTKRRVSNAE